MKILESGFWECWVEVEKEIVGKEVRGVVDGEGGLCLRLGGCQRGLLDGGGLLRVMLLVRLGADELNTCL